MNEDTNGGRGLGRRGCAWKTAATALGRLSFSGMAELKGVRQIGEGGDEMTGVAAVHKNERLHISALSLPGASMAQRMNHRERRTHCTQHTLRNDIVLLFVEERTALLSHSCDIGH